MPRVHPDVTVGQALDHRILHVELVDDLSEELLDDVLEGHEAGGAAVLVDDDREVEAVALHLPQERGDPLGLGHEVRRTGQLGHRSLLVAVALGSHQVLGVDDADDVVDATSGHGQPAEAVEEHDLHGVGHAELRGHRDHVRPRHHHLAHDRVAQLDHRLDELALLGLDDVLLDGEVRDGEELLLRRVRTALEPLAGQQRVGEADEPA